MRDLVSVIIPCFNAARTIEETLQSALSQTLLPSEVIVVDDGSTDDSLAIVAHVAAQHKTVPVKIIEQENQGVSAARNRGVRESRGKWVCFLDADDIWMPEKLERQCSVIGKVPFNNAAVVVGVRRFVDHGARREYLHETIFDWKGDGTCSERIYRILSLVNGEMVVGANVLVSKALFETVGAWNQSLTMAEDWDLLLRLALDTRVVSVPEALVLYRKHSASVTAKFKDYRSLEYQQKFMILNYASLGQLNNDQIKSVLMKHYWDFLDFTRQSGSAGSVFLRLNLLLRLAATRPASVFEQRFLGHVKNTVLGFG